MKAQAEEKNKLAQQKFQEELQWHIVKAEEEEARLNEMRGKQLTQAEAAAEAAKQQRLEYEQQEAARKA